MSETEDYSFFQHNEPEVIIETLTHLGVKVRMDESLSYLSQHDYVRMCEQFKFVDSSIYNHKESSIDSNGRLVQLTGIMASMCDLDFSQKAEVRDTQNHLDYIAIGINTMGGRLKDKFGSMELEIENKCKKETIISGILQQMAQEIENIITENSI
jgi:nitrate/nitrite-specific signal transduction histidine kinase